MSDDKKPTPPDRPAPSTEIPTRPDAPLAAAVSPTGTPHVPPWLVPNLGGGTAALLVVVGVLTTEFQYVKWLSVASQIVSGLALLFGISSPGLRKAAPMVVVAVLALGLTSCAALKPLPTQTIACAEASVAGAIPGLLTEAGTALFAPPCDPSNSSCHPYAQLLDYLVARGGAAALCSLRSLIADLEAGTAGGAGAGKVSGVPPVVAIARGEAFLSQYRFSGVR
jgi:hypothetical protein